MEKIRKLEELSLNDLLTVDTNNEVISIEGNSVEEIYKLIPDRRTFFGKDGLYSDVEENGIIIKIPRDYDKTISIDDFLKGIDSGRNSKVILIEGFAGCGKSTLVQYILSNQLNTYDYDYNFYNYDLETQNDILIRNEEGQLTRESSIYNAIKKSFFEEFLKKTREDENTILCFNRLLNYCKDYQPFNDLYYKFYNTDTYDSITKYIKDSKKQNIILRNLFEQSNKINSSMCILALDYLFRLAMYKNNKIKKLYICYDNLDSIEDSNDLCGFDDSLAKFRSLIDGFIAFLTSHHFFAPKSTPHFVILATYRKITASLAGLSSTTYREVSKDKIAGSLDNNVTLIDATSAYQYSSIVEKRKNYFEKYFSNHPVQNNDSVQLLIKKFKSWHNLNQNLQIMEDRYACLWNKNYRTCSLIADELYSKPTYNFSSCVNFIENSNIPDGYQQSNNIELDNVLSSYYGSSAILLSNVCKVFNTNKIWDEFLFLTSLNRNANSYKSVSLSRMILTYIYNSDMEVSLLELYSVFCANNLFSYKKLCKILSKMLARNLDGVWRRPIYYAEECIIFEDANDIERVLSFQCEKIKNNDFTFENYSFLLCDSGISYVERLMQEFEFFSNRLCNSNKPLYMYKNIDDIEQILDSVYNAVANCCENLILFSEKYMKINNISLEEYLELKIHPRTSITKSPQLHSERTIFSHIAYLNNVRLYFVDSKVTTNQTERERYNKSFVDYIKKYLDLYYSKIVDITDKRINVANRLREIIKEIDDAIENTNDTNRAILFKSISL